MKKTEVTKVQVVCLDIKVNFGKIQSLISSVCYSLWMMPLSATDGDKLLHYHTDIYS